MRKPLFLVVIALLMLSPTVEAESCSFEKSIEPLCAGIEANEKKGGSVPLGESVMPSKAELENQVTEFEKRKRKLTKEEKEKFTRVFKKAQEYSEQIILDGRSPDELSYEEKGLLSRVQSMKLSDLEQEADQPVCRQEGYLAIVPQTGSIVLCPILFGYSEAALIHATGITIGRALSSCFTTLPKAATKHEPIKPSHDPFDLRCDQRACSPGGLRTCLVDGAKGAISKVKAPDFTTPHAKEFLEEIAKSMKADVADAQAKLAPNVKAYPTCFPAITGDQTDSATGDWFGSGVLARHRESQSKAGGSKEEPIESMALFIDDACRFKKRKNMGPRNGHPDYAVRFNDVAMKNAHLRTQLGCLKDPTATMDCTLSLRKTAAQPSTEGSPVAK